MEKYETELNNLLNLFDLKIKNSYFNLTNYNNNISSVKFKDYEEQSIYNKIRNVALYNIDTNEIYLNLKYYLVGLTHELLHLSSSNKDEKYIRSGFYIINKEKNISRGYGLNEGYTCILDERYFSDYQVKDNTLKESYAIVKYFVRMLEDIVGRDSLEKMYSENNLKLLIEKLSSYTNYPATLNFLKSLDLICIYGDSKMVPNFSIILPNYKYAYTYIAYLYKNVILKNYKDNIIMEDDYNKLFALLENQLNNNKLRFGNIIKLNYKPFKKKEIKRILKREGYGEIDGNSNKRK